MESASSRSTSPPARKIDSKRRIERTGTPVLFAVGLDSTFADVALATYNRTLRDFRDFANASVMVKDKHPSRCTGLRRVRVFKSAGSEDMKWGEWQSVIQIGIALNFAFSTLRDIRHGGLDAEITGLRATIAALSAHPHLSADARTKSVREYQSVLGNFLNARELYIDHDRYIKWPCLIAGMLLCVCLIFSSVQYETIIDGLYYQALLWIVIVLAFAPFIVGGVINVVFDHFTRKDLVSKRRSADQQLKFDVIG